MGMGSDEGAPPEMKALVDLIRALVKANKRVITLTSILGIQKRLMRQYPSLILKFKVDREFDVQCKMQGEAKDLEALGKFLEEYMRTLIEILPKPNLIDKVCTAVKDLGEEAVLELLASGAVEFLPPELMEQIRIAADFGDRLNHLRTADSRVQAITIYERLYSSFFQQAFSILEPREDALQAFCRRLELMIRGHYTFIDDFKISDRYEVSIKVSGNVTLERLLDSLAHVYDSLVYGTSMVWDPDESRGLGRRTALTVLGEFEDLPDSCGVTASLLRGALSSRVRTGTLGLDRLLDGGLERNSNTLLISPDLIERDFLLSSFIRKGFHNGEGILIVVSKMDTDRLLDMLSDAEHDPESNIPLGKVNLHIYAPEKDPEAPAVADQEVKMTDDGPMIERPRNMIDLNKFLIKSVKTYGPGPKRALIEIIDSSKDVFGGDRLYWYLSRYLTVLKENGFATIFLASFRSLGKEQVQNIMDLFENTLEIRRRSSSFSYEIGRVAARKPVMDPKFKLITFSDIGLSIADE